MSTLSAEQTEIIDVYIIMLIIYYNINHMMQSIHHKGIECVFLFVDILQTMTFLH